MTEGLEPMFCNASHAGDPAPAAACRERGAQRVRSPQDGAVAQDEGAAVLCAEKRGVADCVDCACFPCEKVGHLMEGRQGMLMWLVLCLGGGGQDAAEGAL